MTDQEAARYFSPYVKMIRSRIEPLMDPGFTPDALLDLIEEALWANHSTPARQAWRALECGQGTRVLAHLIAVEGY